MSYNLIATQFPLSPQRWVIRPHFLLSIRDKCSSLEAVYYRLASASLFFLVGGGRTCLNPLRGFPVGLTPAGKTDYRVRPSTVDFIQRIGGQWYDGVAGGAYASPGNIVKEWIPIPCGQCIECRLAYSKMWAARMMLEAQDHQSSYFLTLTYDDAHVPLTYYPEPETGEALPAHTLVKRDMQAFIKRLRRVLDYRNRPEIRFYGCGEYGTTTHRPHYHIVVFGLVLDDLVELKTSKLGYKYYRSPLVEQCWPQGYSMVCDVSWETCAYVARYVTKKWTGDYKEFYDTFNLQPEFSLMSRKPGIARAYYEANKDKIYATDELIIPTADGGKIIKPVKYYDNLYDLESPDLLAEIKARRQAKAKRLEVIRQSNTDLSQEEQRLAKTELYMRRLEMLKREDV